MRPTLQAIVMAARGRDSAHARMRASLAASDLTREPIWMEHPPLLKAWDHWAAVHEAAARVATDLVLVLEDDALVNRHIEHNIRTWRWPVAREFGAGFVYNPGGYAEHDSWYEGPREWFGTVGVVYRPRDLPRYVELARDARATTYKDPKTHVEYVKEHPWDMVLTKQIHDLGRRIRVHYPSLVEHMDDEPSKVGNRPNAGTRTSRGTFDEHFRRDPGHGESNRDGAGRWLFPEPPYDVPEYCR